MRSWKSRRLVLGADEGENSSGELTITEKLDPRQVVTFEELLRAMMMEQDATRRVLVRKGLLTDLEVLEEIKVVRREMEGKRGR